MLPGVLPASLKRLHLGGSHISPCKSAPCLRSSRDCNPSHPAPSLPPSLTSAWAAASINL